MTASEAVVWECVARSTLAEHPRRARDTVMHLRVRIIAPARQIIHGAFLRRYLRVELYPIIGL